jgi:hypothetical protein
MLTCCINEIDFVGNNNPLLVKKNALFIAKILKLAVLIKEVEPMQRR